MILEAMQRIRRLEQRVDALEAENARLKAERASEPASEYVIDQGTKQAPARKRGSAR